MRPLPARRPPRSPPLLPERSSRRCRGSPISRAGRRQPPRRQSLEHPHRSPHSGGGAGEEHLLDDGRRQGARRADARRHATANGIAERMAVGGIPARCAGSAMLGPLRLGSEWLIATRAPVSRRPRAQCRRREAGRWLTRDLDELIAEAHLARLVDMGYDFELSQVEPRSARPRIFVELEHGASGRCGRGPRSVCPLRAAVPGSYLQVAIRPRTGWFPASLLASEIAPSRVLDLAARLRHP